MSNLIPRAHRMHFRSLAKEMEARQDMPKAGADVTLMADGPDKTILRYEAKAAIGGKLAQLGSRLIQSTAKKLATKFFKSFAEVVNDNATA